MTGGRLSRCKSCQASQNRHPNRVLPHRHPCLLLWTHPLGRRLSPCHLLPTPTTIPRTVATHGPASPGGAPSCHAAFTAAASTTPPRVNRSSGECSAACYGTCLPQPTTSQHALRSMM